MHRPIHPDFARLLQHKDDALIALFTDVRAFILELAPDSTELLYHTHALTAVFSVTEKLGDAFCMLPIYTKHVNLGFNHGTLLPDPRGLLTGTGKLIRHIPIATHKDYRNAAVRALVRASMRQATDDLEYPARATGGTISKIKPKGPRMT